MTSKDQWPQWLKDADTEHASVEITDKGQVIWLGGVWHNGLWYTGVWQGGQWLGGVWRNGLWYNGAWQGGQWLGGEWHNGEWHGGVWRDGVWRDGVWKYGIWCGGEWRNGEWQGGVWGDGVWRDGVWCGGEWRNGEWRGGATVPTRARYIPLIHPDGDIAFGCQKRSREQWEKVITGELECAEAPDKDTEGWRLLVAAYRAACAYADALTGQGGKK